MAELARMGYRTAGERDGARGVEAALRLLAHGRPDGCRAAGPERDRGDATDQGGSAHARLPRPRDDGQRRQEPGRARAAGCDAFFRKPFDPAAIDQFLRKFTCAADQAQVHVRPEMVKECTCGRQFSLTQWLALPQGGRMHVPQRGVVIELRTCTCGLLPDGGAGRRRIRGRPGSRASVGPARRIRGAEADDPGGRSRSARPPPPPAVPG